MLNSSLYLFVCLIQVLGLKECIYSLGFWSLIWFKPLLMCPKNDRDNPEMNTIMRVCTNIQQMKMNKFEKCVKMSFKIQIRNNKGFDIIVYLLKNGYLLRSFSLLFIIPLARRKVYWNNIGRKEWCSFEEKNQARDISSCYRK